MTEPEGKLLAAALDRIDTLYEMANSQQKQIDALADAVQNMHVVVSGLVEEVNNNYKRMQVMVPKTPRSEPVVEDVDPMTLLEEAEPTDDSFPTDIGAVERAKLQRRVHNEQDEEKGQ